MRTPTRTTIIRSLPALLALFCTALCAATSPLQNTKTPPRVRAAHQFLAHRGLAPGKSRPHLPNPRKQATPATTVATTIWTSVGPLAVNSLNYGPVTGRISAIAFNPADASGNTLLVGTTGGGLWASQNAASVTPSAVQFLPITDNLAALINVPDTSLSVGAVTVQPGATGVLLVGLGDPNDALDSYYGAGILRSTDNGVTWSLIQQTRDLEDNLANQDFSFLGEGFAGFSWSTTNPQLVVAAVSQAYEATLVNAEQPGISYEGLYWSTDSGATWHLARITDPDGLDVQGPLDAASQPDGNAATAVVWNPVRQLFIAAIRFHGYYQSSDGQNWTQIPSQPSAALTPANCPTQSGTAGAPGCPIFRGSLAVNPQTGDTFAWSVDLFNQDQGIWQDQCTPNANLTACANPTLTFATQLNTAALESSDQNGPLTIENGDYNLTLAAIPSALGAGQDTLLFAGDNDLWKCSLANSCQWRNTTNATTCFSAQVAEYQHSLASNPANPDQLFIGTDGGLWRSTDLVGETGTPCASTDASHWQNLNPSLGSLAEVAALAQSAATPATMLTGLGPNSFAAIVNAPTPPGNWNQVLSGEGGPVAIDANSSLNNWYASNTAGVAILHCYSASICTPAAFGTTPVLGESQVQNDGLAMTYPAEFRIDAIDHNQLLVGTCRLWRGPASGSGWSSANAISPILDGLASSPNASCNGNALIRSIAAAPLPNGKEVLYVGIAGLYDGGATIPGHIFTATVSATGGASAWTDIALAPVLNSGFAFNAFGLPVSSLFIDSHDPSGNTLYAALSGFADPEEPLLQLYLTTDAGAHWNSIHANLPNAPANAVVVDSQDANTVYVATDAGVFFTRNISSCPTSSCWTAYGAGLPLAPVTTLTATNTAATSLTLTAGTYGRGTWQIPQVTAGTSLTSATLTPSALNFPSLTVGTTSSPQTLTLKATGTANLLPTAIEMSGAASADFQETDNCTGTSIGQNASCQIKITFTPTQAGSRTANLAISANIPGGQILASLTGIGIATPDLTLLPSALTFAAQQVNTTSPTQAINLQNIGGTPITLFSVVTTPPFLKASTTCVNPLAVSSACAFTVAFAPTQGGPATGTFTLTDSAGTQVASLTGTGLLAPTDTLSTTNYSFPATVIGQLAAPLNITLTNSGGLPLTNIGTSVATSLGNSDFTATSNCGTQLAPASSCSLSVEFSPSVFGTESATLTVSDAIRSQLVNLNGFGLNPPTLSLSPSALTFPGQQINLPAPTRTLSLSNRGSAPLAQPTFSIAGTGASSFTIATTTCTAPVPANASCALQILFTPLVSGSNTAVLTVASTSPGVPSANVTLAGTGLIPPILTLSPTALNLGVVVLGNSTLADNILVTNTGQVSMDLPTFAISGIAGPPGSLATDFAISPPPDIPACTGTLNPSASCNVQVTFSPSVVGTESSTLIATANNAIPTTATVSLSGTGAPTISLQASPTNLAFSASSVGVSTSPLTVIISNLGRQSANGLAFSISGPYQLVPATTTCTAKLLAASSCNVGITFTPTAAGDQPGLLTGTVNNIGIAPITVPLDGTGLSVAGILFSPAQFTFGSIVLNTPSTLQTLTITNSGQAPLNGIALSVNGDFSLSANQCPDTLAPAAVCTTAIGFTPTATGLRYGNLTLNTASAGVPPSVVPLTGNGIPAGSLSANPAVLSFGTLLVAQTSNAQTVTLSNVGATTLTGLQFSPVGDYSITANTCTAQLSPATYCSLSIAFDPTQPGTRIGAITVLAANPNFIPVIIGLSGTGLPTVQLLVSPGQLTFPSTLVGTDSAPLSLTISNPGSGLLTGLSITAANPFSAGSGSCSTSLPAASTCSVPITFAPQTPGLQAGVVTLSTTSLGVPAVSVPITASATLPPSLNFSPPLLNFPGTTLNRTSPAQIVTLTNPGSLPIAALALTLSGSAANDFAILSTNCATTLPALTSCSANLTFTPAALGGRQAFLTAATSSPGVAPQSLTLNGIGLTPAALSISPSQLTFPTTLIGQSSAPLLTTVSNSGQSSITDLQLAISPGFAISPATTCSATLPGNSTCSAAIAFTPLAGSSILPGAITGSFTAQSQLSAIPAASTLLTGTAAYPPAILTNPATILQFSTTDVGHSSPPSAVTLSNQGTLSPLTALTFAIDATGTANGFAVSNSNSSPCPSSLPAGASCVLNVSFTPTSAPPNATALTGTLLLNSASAASPTSLPLAGIPFNLTLNVQGSSSATVVQGQTAYYSLAVLPLGAPSGTIQFACGTLPTDAFCLFNPPLLSSLPANVTGTLTLGIGTGAPTVAQVGAHNSTLLILGGVFPIAIFFRRRTRRCNLARLLWMCILAIAMLVGALGALTSCASAGTSGGLGHLGGGTAPGSYPITVTATANGLTQSAHVTLIVN